jgi:hypothetical protein
MAAAIYLAMTAAEISGAESLPANLCWMDSHFSPCDRGLSGLPSSLPPSSLLMVTDRIPWCGHNPELILKQLEQAVHRLHLYGVILDFEKPGCPELRAFAELLTASLPCPAAVTDRYAKNLSCPVFLSPCPHHTSLAEYLQPWIGREIWLDLARDAQTLILTRTGCTTLPLPMGELPENGHLDESLHCHYRTETSEDSACFTLWRTMEDLEALAQEAKTLGVKTLVGLYQELHCANTEKHPSH